MSKKRIWNWRQTLRLLDVLQQQIEESAWKHTPVQFLPDDFYDTQDAFNMVRDKVQWLEDNTEYVE